MKNAPNFDRYVPKNDREHLTFIQSSRVMWRRWRCWSGNPGKSNDLGILGEEWTCVLCDDEQSKEIYFSLG